jgi:hypothetical protein
LGWFYPWGALNPLKQRLLTTDLLIRTQIKLSLLMGEGMVVTDMEVIMEATVGMGDMDMATDMVITAGIMVGGATTVDMVTALAMVDTLLSLMLSLMRFLLLLSRRHLEAFISRRRPLTGRLTNSYLIL